MLAKLDYPVYFSLTRQPLPENRVGIFERLKADGLIVPDVGGHWDITNLGAILFAKRLDDFSVSIARKAVRFVAYGGTDRAAEVVRRLDSARGYACGFDALIESIEAQLPYSEHIGRSFRDERKVYPTVAIRELVANALIHQDMTITGAGPLIEMFDGRLEITSPGSALIEPERFLDMAPKSRNEALASLMRRMGFCEEQGTGVDKVLLAVELHQLPPPDFRREAGAVRAVLFAPRSVLDMSPDERVRACYQHASLKYLSGSYMKNATLRERFGGASGPMVSRVIVLSRQAGLIRPADPDRPQAAYVPYWA